MQTMSAGTDWQAMVAARLAELDKQIAATVKDREVVLEQAKALTQLANDLRAERAIVERWPQVGKRKGAGAISPPDAEDIADASGAD